MNYHYTDPNNNELNVKLPEYFTDNVRQHALPKRLRVEESDAQREMRQAKDAARTAVRRRHESSPERHKRLSSSASHIALKRKTESDEQRRMRLAKDAARTADRRRRETFAERETRLALDAARHASKRHGIEDGVAAGSAKHVHEDPNNIVRSTYTPFGSSAHQAYHGDGVPHPNVTNHLSPVSTAHGSSNTSTQHVHPPNMDHSRGYQSSPVSRNETKYGNLLNVIEDLGREIKPTYAGSKMSQDRLRKGIMHARELVRGCLSEVEKKMR